MTVRRGDPFVECRTLGHSWDRLGTRYSPNNSVWRFELELRCTRCGTTRLDGIDVYGAVRSRRYVYPTSYSYARDETPSRAEFRLRMLNRERRRAGASPRRTDLRLVTAQ